MSAKNNILRLNQKLLQRLINLRIGWYKDRWPLVIALLSFSVIYMGCSKKNGNANLPSQIYRNGSGASVVDPSKAQSASLYAEANGVQIDILNLKRTVQTTGSVTIESVLQIGNETTLPLYSTHYNLGVVFGRITYQDLTFETFAQCANVACDRYILVIDVLRNGAPIIQQALRQDFSQPTNSHYQWLKPEDRMPFSSLVEYLGGY